MIMIVDYRAEHQPWFENLNREWIERVFKMEQVDVNVLTRPEEFILKDGGVILMAYWNNEIAGTVALRKMKSGDYELTKMAVDEKFRGKGIGEALIHGLIDRAKEMGLRRVILYSNTVLENASATLSNLPSLPGTRCQTSGTKLETANPLMAVLMGQ